MRSFLKLALIFGFCLAARAQQPVLRDLSCVTASSSAVAYACSIAVPPAAYVIKTAYRFQADTPNTGAATINFNGLGAKPIVKNNSGTLGPLTGGEIAAGQWVTVTYDGVSMQLGTGSSSGSGGGGSVGPPPTISAAGCTFTTVTGTSIGGTFQLQSGGPNCTVTLTFVSATVNYFCTPLQNNTSSALATQTSASTTTAAFSSMNMAINDVLQYACVAPVSGGGSGGSGLQPPGANNVIPFYTSGFATRPLLFADLLSLFTGTCNTTTSYLRSDGTCNVPPGTGGGGGIISAGPLASRPTSSTAGYGYIATDVTPLGASQLSIYGTSWTQSLSLTGGNLIINSSGALSTNPATIDTIASATSLTGRKTMVGGFNAGSETVTWASTVAFSPTLGTSNITLLGNTTFTLANGTAEGDQKILNIVDTPGGSTLTAPSNVTGFPTLGLPANGKTRIALSWNSVVNLWVGPGTTTTAANVVSYLNCSGVAASDTALVQGAFTFLAGTSGTEFHWPVNGQACDFNAPILIKNLNGAKIFHGNTVWQGPASRTITCTGTTFSYPFLTYTGCTGTLPSVNDDITSSGATASGNNCGTAAGNSNAQCIVTAASGTSVTVANNNGAAATGQTITLTILRPVFVFSNVDHSRMEGGTLTTSSSNPAGIAVQIQEDTVTGTTFSNQDTFDTIEVQGSSSGGLQTCFGVVDGAYGYGGNNYGHMFRGTNCDNYSDAAYIVDDPQAGTMRLDGASSNASSSGKYFLYNTAGAHVTVEGGLTTGNTVTDFQFCGFATNALVIHGLHSEQSNRAIATNCYTQQTLIMVEGYNFYTDALNSDGHVMYIASPGPVNVVGSNFGRPGVTKTVDIYFNLTAAPVFGTITGNLSNDTNSKGHNLAQFGSGVTHTVVSCANMYTDSSGISSAPTTPETCVP